MINTISVLRVLSVSSEDYITFHTKCQLREKLYRNSLCENYPSFIFSPYQNLTQFLASVIMIFVAKITIALIETIKNLCSRIFHTEKGCVYAARSNSRGA